MGISVLPAEIFFGDMVFCAGGHCFQGGAGRNGGAGQVFEQGNWAFGGARRRIVDEAEGIGGCFLAGGTHASGETVRRVPKWLCRTREALKRKRETLHTMRKT